MKDYQQRVVNERADLDQKIAALQDFISGERFVNVREAEQERLKKQFNAMREYSRILGERIVGFEEET
jgi:hypothetical protein